MAKFFNQKVKKGKKSKTSSISKTVIFAVIGVIIVIFAGVLLTVYAKNNHKDVSVKLREKIAVEINNKDVSMFQCIISNISVVYGMDENQNNMTDFGYKALDIYDKVYFQIHNE